MKLFSCNSRLAQGGADCRQFLNFLHHPPLKTSRSYCLKISVVEAFMHICSSVLNISSVCVRVTWIRWLRSMLRRLHFRQIFDSPRPPLHPLNDLRSSLSADFAYICWHGRKNFHLYEKFRKRQRRCTRFEECFLFDFDDTRSEIIIKSSSETHHIVDKWWCCCRRRRRRDEKIDLKVRKVVIVDKVAIKHVIIH
jgi:hypothetical protein